jgi:hypothetical protein
MHPKHSQGIDACGSLLVWLKLIASKAASVSVMLCFSEVTQSTAESFLSRFDQKGIYSLQIQHCMSSLIPSNLTFRAIRDSSDQLICDT